MSPEQLEAIQSSELNAVTMTYVAVGLVLLVTWIVIAASKMPRASEEDGDLDIVGTLRRLISNRHYVWGVVAQFLLCWRSNWRVVVHNPLRHARAQSGANRS